MTEDKNLTPFSIADILKSNDRGAGGGDDGAGADAGHHAKNNEALDMTNNKKGTEHNTTRVYVIKPIDKFINLFLNSLKYKLVPIVNTEKSKPKGCRRDRFFKGFIIYSQF